MASTGLDITSASATHYSFHPTHQMDQMSDTCSRSAPLHSSLATRLSASRTTGKSTETKSRTRSGLGLLYFKSEASSHRSCSTTTLTRLSCQNKLQSHMNLQERRENYMNSLIFHSDHGAKSASRLEVLVTTIDKYTTRNHSFKWTMHS